MAGPSPLVILRGELRSITPRETTNKATGEVRNAAVALVLTELPGHEAEAGFAEIYIAPELCGQIPADGHKGRDVEFVCRAYSVNRTFGSDANSRQGAVLGLSYVGGTWGAARPDAPVPDWAVEQSSAAAELAATYDDEPVPAGL
jgi:hypothetical protein